MNVEQRQEIERRLIQHLCLAMRQAGWIPVNVNDGEEDVKCEDDEEVFDIVFGVDESTIIFRRDGVGRKHGVFIVLGNGHDAIADYSYAKDDDFEKVMKEVVDPFADRLEEEGLGAVSPLLPKLGRYSAVQDNAGLWVVWFAPADENEVDVKIASFLNRDDAEKFVDLKNEG